MKTVKRSCFIGKSNGTEILNGGSVKLNRKILALVLGLCVQLSFVVPTRAEVIQTGDRATLSGPEKSSLTMMALSPVVVGDMTLGEVVVYDDPASKRRADYFELYDSAGGLVAVGWFDRFGIQRMAVDRALLDGTNELEGVFVSLLEGDLI
jgi:hypothetical protein